MNTDIMQIYGNQASRNHPGVKQTTYNGLLVHWKLTISLTKLFIGQHHIQTHWSLDCNPKLITNANHLFVFKQNTC